MHSRPGRSVVRAVHTSARPCTRRTMRMGASRCARRAALCIDGGTQPALGTGRAHRSPAVHGAHRVQRRITVCTGEPHCGSTTGRIDCGTQPAVSTAGRSPRSAPAAHTGARPCTGRAVCTGAPLSARAERGLVQLMTRALQRAQSRPGSRCSCTERSWPQRHVVEIGPRRGAVRAGRPVLCGSVTVPRPRRGRTEAEYRCIEFPDVAKGEGVDLWAGAP